MNILLTNHRNIVFIVYLMVKYRYLFYTIMDNHTITFYFGGLLKDRPLSILHLQTLTTTGDQDTLDFV